MPAKFRRDSVTRSTVASRYTEDFVEEGRLGKGGFGEVVKARKKLDGQIYAIKKISQRSHASLTEILKEVRLLSQLSHPAVVRYYNTWVEEVPDTGSIEGDTSTEGYTDETRETGSDGVDIQFHTDTGGLDFMSSNAGIEFGYDDDSEEGDDDETEDEESTDEDDEAVDDQSGSSMKIRPIGINNRRDRFHRPFRTIMYISMEYCEKRTLRDLISRGLYKNTPEIWRLFRQILEGLAHIHSLSIVHRDLKPENIFIGSGADGVDNVKIGDFGLATSGQFSVDKAAANTFDTDDLTKSIGTASYSAPEVRSAANGMYSTKVDMYSLGIIFFEMCYIPMMHMQKADVIGQLRRQQPVLPPDFKPADKVQSEIVLSLVSHNPKERPSSAELLKSGKLPVQMESETIRRTLAGLSDPNSPYYQKMLSTLFSRPVETTRDYAWDMFATSPNATDLLHQSTVKQSLISIFRRHGALELARTSIYPKSTLYGDNAFRVLDSNGTVLQLPYDLTMGHARMLAKSSHNPAVQRTFTFGSVFRDKQDTGHPQMFGEVDFDIVTIDALDLALKEAEVLKVIDEIIVNFPSLSSLQMCFHIGHSDLLQLIFEHCGIEPALRRGAADVLSKLNIHGHTWQKIRIELRSPVVGISATSVDELQKFDFRGVKPCGELDMDAKCSLILEHVPKFSASFPEGTSFCLSQEGSKQNCDAINLVKEPDYASLQNDNDDMAMIGLDAMQRANSTLEDFCRSYFMFHGMDVKNPREVFQYLPLLQFIESYIYQLDTMNEKILDIPANRIFEKGFEKEIDRSLVSKLVRVLKSDPFGPLVVLLETHGLLTERIGEEFKCGEEYWALERKLCSALMSKEEISIDLVMKAIYLKSFDYRVLNLLLYQLRREKVNDLQMEFLSISEFLVEISDDLFDYEDDVLENNFNILRMFISIYGPSKAPTMLAKCIAEAEEKYQTLLKSLDPQLQMAYQRRCEEATRDGGKISGYPLGTWSIPTLIVDEESYRSNLLNSK